MSRAGSEERKHQLVIEVSGFITYTLVTMHHDDDILEDDHDDILAKALSAHGRSKTELPGLSLSLIGLDSKALDQLPARIPMIRFPQGLQRHIRPFGQWTLNIWTIQTPEGTIVIDTGCTPEDLLAATRAAKPSLILITHNDHDHTGGQKAWRDTVIMGPGDLAPGKTYQLNGLTWKIHDLKGHTADGLGYETRWRDTTLFFPGDSIFARSIGKPRVGISVTIDQIIRAIKPMPDDTIICPGHGPATTVGDEKAGNPFLARYFKQP